MEYVEWILSTLRFASPLALVALGGILSERSGVINIGLEGLILVGAFTAASLAFATGNPWLALSGGAAAGMLFALFFAVLTVGLQCDHVVAGTAINMLAWGGIPFVGKLMFDSTANTPSLELSARLPAASPMVISVTAAVVVFWLLRYTSFGLWLTFAGEKPAALTAVGVRVWVVRFWGVAMSGLLAGVAGGVLSIALSSSYTRNMAAGRGFIALAALILGKWRPIPAVAASLLFGFCEVLQLRLQGTSLGGFGEIPVQLVQIIPYGLTLVMLAGFVGESRPPAALGQVEKVPT